jgi:hypothetical protein
MLIIFIKERVTISGYCKADCAGFKPAAELNLGTRLLTPVEDPV